MLLLGGGGWEVCIVAVGGSLFMLQRHKVKKRSNKKKLVPGMTTI